MSSRVGGNPHRVCAKRMWRKNGSRNRRWTTATKSKKTQRGEWWESSSGGTERRKNEGLEGLSGNRWCMILTSWHDMTWYDMMWNHVLWHDMTGMIWCDVMWYDTMWCDCGVYVISYDVMCICCVMIRMISHDVVWWSNLFSYVCIHTPPAACSTGWGAAGGRADIWSFCFVCM